MASTREQLLARKEELKNELKEIDKQIYELEPTIFTVTDEYSGRVITLHRNPYNLSLKYPKVHPKTGQRLYVRQAHWNKYNGDYCVSYSMEENFPDVEYIDNTCETVDDINYSIYNTDRGWTKPGYYWYDTSGDFDLRSSYYECKIPTKNPNKKRRVIKEK